MLAPEWHCHTCQRLILLGVPPQDTMVAVTTFHKWDSCHQRNDTKAVVPIRTPIPMPVLLCTTLTQARLIRAPDHILLPGLVPTSYLRNLIMGGPATLPSTPKA